MTNTREENAADMAHDEKRLSIEIDWENVPHKTAPILYQFDTQAELTAFRLGVEACNSEIGPGWTEYEILYTDEE